MSSVNFTMNADQFNEGVKEFTKEVYKGTFKKGLFKKAMILYFLALLTFITLGIFVQEERVFCFTMAGILLAGVIIVLGIILINVAIISKRKNKIGVENVEHKYEDKIYIDTYFSNGSVNSAQYNYSDIKNIVENERFFFLFIGEYNAIPLVKEDMDKNAFIELMIEKGIPVKERL